MSSDVNSKAAYQGRILNGDFSPELKDKLKKAIPVFQAFDQEGSPAIPYISAWQGNKKNIWYEFVSRKFLALLNCGPSNIADILRSTIVDRRIYKSRFADPKFVDPDNGDYRLAPDSPARRIRTDDDPIGAESLWN